MYAVTKTSSCSMKKRRRASIFGRGGRGGNTEKEKSFRPHLENVENLSRTSNYRVDELRVLYRGFKQDCPTGYLTEDTLKEIYSQLFPLGDSKMYAHYVFHMLDTDSSGVVTFDQMVSCMSEMARGSKTEKLKWIFSFYDINRDGRVTEEEMVKVISSIYSMTGRRCPTPGGTLSEVVSQHASTVFNQMDKTKKGTVSMEEFIKTCQQDEKIITSLEMMDTSI